MIKGTMSKTTAFILMIFLALGCSSEEKTTGYLTDDGAWCWFSDPRAIFDGDEVIAGWVTVDGSIEAASFDPVNRRIDKKVLYSKLEVDDHDNPAFVKTGSGDIIAAYTTHGGPGRFFSNRTAEASQVTSFGAAKEISMLDSAMLEEFPRVHITYANPFRLEAEQGRLYCFGRWTGFKPNVMWSDDDGATWSKSKVFITNYPFDPNNRPYVKYYSDGQSRIHMTFTDGHPLVEPTNSVYYTYYEDGAFYRADGSEIANMDSIPFEPLDATVIYRSTEEEGRAWVADIAADEQGNPVILYTRSPKDTDHRYWYARFNGQEWLNIEMCSAGKWFPQTQEGEKERETYYFGNMSLDPVNPGVVYLSREVNGIFEIERWETGDGGKSWNSEAVTVNSEYDNVRPYVPRYGDGSTELVFWMENKRYVHYTDYQTSIKYYIHQ